MASSEGVERCRIGNVEEKNSEVWEGWQMMEPWLAGRNVQLALE